VPYKGAGPAVTATVGGEMNAVFTSMPAAGEFRIHDHWGGTVEMVEPDAAVVEVTAGGEHLGPVGGRIVAEVIVGLIKGDRQSYLRQDPDWIPTYGTGDSFTMSVLPLGNTSFTSFR